MTSQFSSRCVINTTKNGFHRSKIFHNNNKCSNKNKNGPFPFYGLNCFGENTGMRFLSRAAILCTFQATVVG
jgi:hypothetical protein